MTPTQTPTDRMNQAIVAAKRLMTAQNIRDAGWDHAFARALVADLLRDMDDPPLDPEPMMGWDLAIKVIKRRAGIVEGEG